MEVIDRSCVSYSCGRLVLYGKTLVLCVSPQEHQNEGGVLVEKRGALPPLLSPESYSFGEVSVEEGHCNPLYEKPLRILPGRKGFPHWYGPPLP